MIYKVYGSYYTPDYELTSLLANYDSTEDINDLVNTANEYDTDTRYHYEYWED